MSLENELCECVAGYLEGLALFGSATVPIVTESATDQRDRPCVVVSAEAAGRLADKLPVKMLKVEILTQRNDTEAAEAAGWAEAVIDEVNNGALAIAGLMQSRGWLIKGFSIRDDSEEKEGKRAWAGEASWRIVFLKA